MEKEKTSNIYTFLRYSILDSLILRYWIPGKNSIKSQIVWKNSQEWADDIGGENKGGKNKMYSIN